MSCKLFIKLSGLRTLVVKADYTGTFPVQRFHLMAVKLLLYIHPTLGTGHPDTPFPNSSSPILIQSVPIPDMVYSHLLGSGCTVFKGLLLHVGWADDLNKEGFCNSYCWTFELCHSWQKEYFSCLFPGCYFPSYDLYLMTMCEGCNHSPCPTWSCLCRKTQICKLLFSKTYKAVSNPDIKSDYVLCPASLIKAINISISKKTFYKYSYMTFDKFSFWFTIAAFNGFIQLWSIPPTWTAVTLALFSSQLCPLMSSWTEIKAVL